MAIYSVYLPPKGQNATDLATRTLFVREGFSWAALGFGPLWLFWNRLWLALAAYILAILLIIIAVKSWGLGVPAAVILIALGDYYLGFEGAGLKASRLERRQFQFADVVTGAKIDEVERRYFSRWRKHIAESPVPANGG